MNKEDVIVITNKENIIISYNGIKLIKSIEKFKGLSEYQIKEWFIDEFNREE